MYEEQHLTHDAAVADFDDSASGITTDDSGDVQFDWDEVETVTIDDPPHAEAFDTKEFYKIPATVAKPIPQPYRFGEDTVWLKKPREELKKSAWSLDNAPWTHGHPETGMVKNVDDVRGFWSDPRYIDSLDDLDADLHVPVHDDESKEHIEEHEDVSVGFYNTVARVDEYDGVVGGTDDEDDRVEGYQTNMLFDHCASVGVGRCSGSQGCGLDDAPGHGHVVDSFISDTTPTDKGDAGEEDSLGSEEPVSDMQPTTDAPSGIHVADGNWFAIGPDEHPDESTDYADDAKFPVNSCADIRDAWNLRGTGDISIDEGTLESRIQRVADSKDCDLPDTAEDTQPDPSEIADSAKRYSICGARKDVDGVRDCSCDDDTTTEHTMTEEDGSGIDIGVDDLSTDAALAKVESQHDGVSERLDELREAEEDADDVEDAVDEVESVDDPSDLADAISMLQDRNDELEEKVHDLREPQMREDAEFIAERTERYGESADDVLDELDEEPETVAEKRDLVEDLTEGYDEQTANSGDSDDEPSGSTDRSGHYAASPWE